MTVGTPGFDLNLPTDSKTRFPVKTAKTKSGGNIKFNVKTLLFMENHYF